MCSGRPCVDRGDTPADYWRVAKLVIGAAGVIASPVTGSLSGVGGALLFYDGAAEEPVSSTITESALSLTDMRPETVERFSLTAGYTEAAITLKWGAFLSLGSGRFIDATSDAVFSTRSIYELNSRGVSSRDNNVELNP